MKRELNDRYDLETGLPNDESYLEKDLPILVSEAIALVEDGYRRMKAGERLLHFDLDYDQLVSELTVAEAEGEISHRQAIYLRHKYL